jgi:hypothetical protein
VILFALIYLRNSAVSSRESFPICQKNGFKFIPIRYEFSQNGSSLDSRACKHRAPFVLGIYVTFLEDWEIYIIVLKTEFEVNIVLQIVQHILMKGERNGKNEHVLSAFYKT